MFPDCSGASTEDGVIDFAGRDKTSSSELGVELGIKVNLHTPRCFCEENVLRDWYGCTCLVHVRRDAMSDFASSLTWFSDFWSMHGEMRCRILLRL